MGKLEIMVGPMFAGKTEELLRRIKRARIAKQKVVVFKPQLDWRYGEKQVCSHSGVKEQAVPIDNVWEIPKQALEYDVVAIDEVQFFAPEIVAVVESLINQGKRVVVSGLDMDFQGKPFEVCALLMAKAEKVDKLTAVCVECGIDATRTQRRVEGKPVYEGETVEIGGSENYVAVCGNCY